MYQIHFQQPIHIHFIGIGGISMSGLAEVLCNAGFTVSGSDMKTSALTEHLKSLGIRVSCPQSAENITDEIQAVVYTAAIHQDNPELQAALSKGLPLLTRAELLGQMMCNYKTPIAIAGTHGKTTTTSMVSEILLAADADPTISVGGILPTIGGNIRIGNSDVFVTEACEYTNSYHSFFPKYAVILNIDADHLDFFKDLDDIRASFRKFAELLPEDGCLVINADIPDLDEFTKGLACKIITYSIEKPADYSAQDIVYGENGCASFTILRKGQPYKVCTLQVPGMHNVCNALASMALADDLGIDADKSIEGLYNFTGTERRFQYKGKLGDITVIDDYAHHPTEIRATLSALKNYPHKTLWCVFQPHTYTRTKALLKEFAQALKDADRVILPDIYAARETDDLGISSDDLRQELLELGTECYYLPSFDEVENFLLKNCTAGDLILTMGAGDVVKIGESLLGL